MRSELGRIQLALDREVVLLLGCLQAGGREGCRGGHESGWPGRSGGSELRLKGGKVRFLYIVQMADLAPKLLRPRLIVKQEHSSSPGYPRCPGAQQTPPKRGRPSSVEELVTVKREERGGPVLFASSQSYRLDYLNSLTLDEGRLFNLLTVQSQRPKGGRKIKCKCSKSRCGSKYCECFSRGVICGVECECCNCHNLVVPEASKKPVPEERGCRCSKSHCLKNYCECFQRGEHCDDKCGCTNCENVTL